MGRIKEYTSQTDVQGAANGPRGVDASGDTGINGGLVKLGQAVSQTGEILARRAEQEEVSNINAQVADAKVKFTVDWQDRLQKGELNTDKFLQSYDDYMSQVGENLGTRAGRFRFQEANAQMRSHFIETAAQGESKLAGERAVQNYMASASKLTSSLMADPSSFELAKNLHDQGIDDLVKTGGLPADAAFKYKVQGASKLAESAVRGWIDLDPAMGQKELESGRWDGLISGDVKHQLEGEVRQGFAAQAAEKAGQEAELKRLKAEQQNVTQNDFLAKMMEGKLTGKDILRSNLDPFGSGSKETFISMLKTNSDGKPRTDPGVFMETWRRVHLPDGDPNKIVDENDLNAMVGKGLSVPDLQMFRGEIQGKRTEAGGVEAQLKSQLVDMAKTKLVDANPMLGIKDAEGETQMLKFMAWFLPEYSAQRKAGKTPIQLLSPDSPDYLGKHMNQFYKTPEQIMRGNLKGVTGSEEPAPAPSANKKVWVISPNGQRGQIPAENLEKALSQGYKKAD
jgi:hypothetical protein